MILAATEITAPHGAELPRRADGLKHSVDIANAGRLPLLVGEERSFNIVQYGEQYVAVAQELGSIDVSEVMAGRLSQPPANKFILGCSIQDLKPMIAAATEIAARGTWQRKIP
jgi:hypothetical protein